ncbi:sodium:solute symporter [Ruminococcus sp. OA3]|uniref:sodium:solute symporter n=1 Tax=Ruminococcus sp. OA3 TaxID=2914164 RepID=UPI001F066AC0|nr:sodium:solute symporter [Ruminococcus sp. OA3]MCH1982549.1 sodium:solute symporter [Ruminococcus sp. OA3]
MKGFTTIDLVILVVYLAAVLFAGLHFSKKEMKGKEFFKGDGTIPWWVTSVSIFATLLSPISFLSLAGNSYGGTWILWFAQLGMLIAIPLTIRFFLPIYSKLDIDTAYHYLELRFHSKGLRVLGAVMFIIYQIGRMSIIMYLPSMVLANLTGINVNILIIVMGVIAIIYSYTGGLKSVLWTDFIQGSVLLIGVTFALVFLIFHIDGGMGAIFESFTAGKFLGGDEAIFDWNFLKNSVFIIVVGAGLNTCSSYISSQDIVQRFTTTTDTKKLNKMMLTNGALSIFIATVFYLIGTGLYVFYGQNPDLAQTVQQDQIFASFIAYQLPVGITGVLLAAIYAASQSTLSTGLNSVATSWTLDIQERLSKKEMSFKLQTRIAQFVSLGVGIVAILISMVLANGEIKSAYEWFNGFMGLVLGVLGGTFVLGAFTKVATTLGAYVAFGVSAVIIIWVKYTQPEVSIWSYSLITIGISVVVGLIVSYIHRAVTGNKEQPDEKTTIYGIGKKKEEA